MNEEQKIVNVNSIKSLYITILFNETVLASATGFIVNNGTNCYLITNRHVVTGRDNETNECLDENGAIPNKIQVWLPYQTGTGLAWNNREINLIDENDNTLWIEHPIFKGKIDVVALKIDNYNQSLFNYRLTSDYKSIVTENVYVIGYPFGFNVDPKNGKYAIWSTGIVASEPDLDLNIRGQQLPAFLIDSKTRQGQSGSPVIYYSSNGIDKRDIGFAICSDPVTYEIGIYSGRINKDSDLGYVWKWSLIKEIIENDK